MNSLKNIKFLINILIYLYSLPYKIHEFFNLPFRFKIKKSFIKFYPIGQIVKGIYFRSFEKNEIILFQNIIKPGMIIIDAGANIGLYTLIASKLVGINGKVLAFEPSKETFQRLKNNIELNSFKNIIAINTGLGNKVNEKQFLRQDLGNLDAERYLLPSNIPFIVNLENKSNLNIEEEILLETIDNVCQINRISNVDFMKIDTEGYEYYILQGCKEVLKKNPKLVILMECTALGTARASTTQEKVFNFLRTFGFDIFYFDYEKNTFSNDNGIFNAGDLWVCKSKSQLLDIL